MGTKKKNILYIGYGIDPKRKEAVSKNTLKRIEILKNKGHNVYLINVGYEVASGSFYGRSMIEAILDRGRVVEKVIREVSKKKIDTIHDVFVLPLSTILFTLPIKKELPGTLLVKEVFNLPGYSKNFNKESIIRLVANNRYFYNLAVSNSDRVVTSNSFLSTKEGFTLLLPPINIKPLKGLYKSRTLSVCYLGHPLKKKGVDVFPRLFSEMSDDLKGKIRFNIAFSNLGPRQKLVERLEDSSKKNDVELKIYGKVSPAEFFRENEVFLLPINDQFGSVSTPNTILEAMEAGCLVLTKRLRTLEGIVSNKNAILLNNIDTQTVLKKFGFILKNTQEVERLRKSARSSMQDLFNSERELGDKLEALYK